MHFSSKLVQHILKFTNDESIFLETLLRIPHPLHEPEYFQCSMQLKGATKSYWLHYYYDTALKRHAPFEVCLRKNDGWQAIQSWQLSGRNYWANIF